MRDAQYWIRKLGLEPHPEGGYFRQTYKSELKIAAEGQKSHPCAENAGRVGQLYGDAPRAASTAIYFLLEKGNFSVLHRLRSDEMWHFYAGSPLVVHVISVEGECSSILLGDDPERGEVFQAVVKAGCWFGAEVARDSDVSQKQRDPSTGSGQAMGHPFYALVGCTVAPGFEFEDFELAKREELAAKYPQHREMIRRLTREW